LKTPEEVLRPGILSEWYANHVVKRMLAFELTLVTEIVVRTCDTLVAKSGTGIHAFIAENSRIISFVFGFVVV